MENAKQKQNLHQGHRLRMKDRFMKKGLDGFEPHEVLELLLFYAIPQGNTNPTAHRLIEKFGSIDRVLDAPYEELLSVNGIGESSAILIKLLPELFRRYAELKAVDGVRAYDSQTIAKIVSPKFIGRTNEAIVLLLLNSKGEILFCDVINEGTVGMAPIYVRKIVELAVRYNADSAILAHNHPSGNPLPSRKDIVATREVLWALESINVTFSDHIIVGENQEYTSLAQAGWLPELEIELQGKKIAAIQKVVEEDEDEDIEIPFEDLPQQQAAHGTHAAEKGKKS